MQKINLDEAQSHLLELIRAAFNGEKIIISADEQQSVELVPVRKPERHPQFGSAKGLITIADDFDAPLDDFKEYME